MHLEIAAPLALLAQAPISITGNPTVDAVIQTGGIFIFIWYLMKEGDRKSEARAKSDAEKTELLREVMAGVKATFEAGFKDLRTGQQEATTQIRDLKQWIVDEIQDARKVRDSDPARTNDRKDN